jgi:hypothetical protein
MREVLTSDFETANIQYIEFWLMDPFTEDPFIRVVISISSKYFGRYPP